MALHWVDLTVHSKAVLKVARWVVQMVSQTVAHLAENSAALMVVH
jgi:hypothetical protein